MRNLFALLFILFIAISLSATPAPVFKTATFTGTPIALCPGTGSGVSSHSIRGKMNTGSSYKVEYRNITDRKSWQTRRGTLNNHLEWTIERLDPGKEYQINIYYFMGTRAVRYGTYKVWSVCNTADFNINGNSSGPVSICGDEPIIVNAAASKEEHSYGIAVREIDQFGRGIGNELLREFQGQAPNGIDLRQFTNNSLHMIGGKRYYVKVFTKPSWQEKVIIVDMKAASLSIKPLATLVSDKNYQQCVLRGAPQLTIDAAASSCDTRYNLNIVEVVNGQEIETTRFAEWITPFTSLPDRLNVAAMYQNAGYNFQSGKHYKVTVAVGFPWAADHFYIKFLNARDCASQTVDQRRNLQRGL